MEASGVAATREDLKSQLFDSVDANGDGKLHKEEMRSLADLVGFMGTDAEWTVEYEKLCSEHRISPSGGIPRSTVMKLLEDRSESGCYCTTQELRDLLGDLRGEDAGADGAAPRSSGGAEARGPAASSSTVFFASANYKTDEEVLRSTFEEAGTIQDFILFRMSDGRSRGMGRVKFRTPEEAKKAVTVLHQQMVDGRRLVVKVDNKAEDEEGGKGGYSGYKGGGKGPGKGFKYVKVQSAEEKAASAAGGDDKGGGVSGEEKASGGKSFGSGKADTSAGKAGGKGANSSWDDGSRDFAPAKGSGSKGYGAKGGGRGGAGGAYGKESYAAYEAYEPGYWDGQASSSTANDTVFFAGASFDTTAATLRKHFEAAGRIQQFWLFQLKDGRSRGMGVVQFHTAREARRSVQIVHGATIDGRELLVKADDVGALQAYEGYADGGEGGKGSAWDEGGWDGGDGKGAWGSSWVGGKGWDMGGGSTGSKGYGGKGGGGWKGGPPMSNRVFFAGAPFSANYQYLQEYFQEFGEIRSFTLFRLGNGRSRGMGVCTFYTSEEAAWALQTGIEVEGRPLYLQEDTSQLAEGGKGGEPHEALATYGGRPRGKGKWAAAYQDYGEGYGEGYDEWGGYDDGYQGYPEYDEWGYEVGRGSGFGRKGGSRSSGGGSHPSGGPPVDDPQKAVFFANVPFGTTETHLRWLFNSVGQVKSFNLFTTQDGRSRGMGVVEYTTEAAAERAYYELHETEVSGRAIIVDACRPT